MTLYKCLILLLFNYSRSKEALEQGQNTQADHLAFKTVEIEQKLSTDNIKTTTSNHHENNG